MLGCRGTGTHEQALQDRRAHPPSAGEIPARSHFNPCRVFQRSQRVVYPADQVEKIIASKNANAGFFNKRQLVFGLFDQRIHGIPDPAWEDGKPPLAEEMAKLVRPKLLLSTCTGSSGTTTTPNVYSLCRQRLHLAS